MKLFPATTLVLIAAIPTALANTPGARIANFSGDRAAAICYTFDDNLRDQFTQAVPMLNEVGFKGTFFVIAGKTAETPGEGEKKAAMTEVKGQWGGISWPELKSMSEQGHEIASHTFSHRNMAKIPAADAEVEISKAVELITKNIGKAPLTLAFPYNQHTPEVEAIALKHHVAFRSFQLGTGGKSTLENLNQWADKLVDEKKLGVIMAHAISHGYAELTDPEILRGHFKYVKNRGQDIWVDTFATVSRYEKERDEAKVQVNGESGNVTCTLTSTLDPTLYNVPLTIVFDVKGAKMVKATRGDQILPSHIHKDTFQIDAAPGEQPITIQWK